MALTAESIDRLKAQLLTSNLQQQNQALFQIINLLIDAVRQSLSATASLTSSSGGSILGQSFLTINNDQGSLVNSRRIVPGTGISFNIDGQRLIISAAIPFGLDGEDGESIVGPPGIQGPQGIAGPAGTNSLTIGPPFYGEELEELIGLPFGTILAATTWQDVPFNAGDFTADAGTWTVTAPNVFGFSFKLIDKDTIVVAFTIAGSAISAAPTDIKVKIPGGRVASRRQDNMGLGHDAIYDGAVQFYVAAGGTVINIRKVVGTWNNGGTISAFGEFTFSIG